jgi:hypothetical protein
MVLGSPMYQDIMKNDIMKSVISAEIDELRFLFLDNLHTEVSLKNMHIYVTLENLGMPFTLHK